MKSVKTVIVEDNYLFRQLLNETLKTAFPSMAIEEAENGKQALEKVNQFMPEIVFMDIKLPDENGLELTKKIKKKYPEMTIIVLTSYDLPEYRQAAFDNGANYFLIKSSSTNEKIVSLVQSITSRA
jgi:DNA-binding NarL/FixJ family response regulator